MEKKNWSCFPYEIYGQSYKVETWKGAIADYALILLVGFGFLTCFAGAVGVCYATTLYWVHGITLF